LTCFRNFTITKSFVFLFDASCAFTSPIRSWKSKTMRLQSVFVALLAGSAAASPAIIGHEKRQAAGAAGFGQGQPISSDGKGAPLLGISLSKHFPIMY